MHASPKNYMKTLTIITLIEELSVTPPIALAVVSEENRCIPFLLLNSFTFSLITY